MNGTGTGTGTGTGKKRIEGFVVGSDEIAGRTVWKVRVKDGNCEHDGKKLAVHSVDPRTKLHGALDVTFFIDSFQIQPQY